MIALDASAVVAIALEEPEVEEFSALIVKSEALIGTPTLFEIHLVLDQRIGRRGADFISDFIKRRPIHPVAFNLGMFELAQVAFDRFGKGKGHPAKLNFGDCMAYAVAQQHDIPLLFKGNDFRKTDIRAALP